jgi:hypothetical protein
MRPARPGHLKVDCAGSVQKSPRNTVESRMPGLSSWALQAYRLASLLLAYRRGPLPPVPTASDADGDPGQDLTRAGARASTTAAEALCPTAG